MSLNDFKSPLGFTLSELVSTRKNLILGFLECANAFHPSGIEEEISVIEEDMDLLISNHFNQ